MDPILSKMFVCNSKAQTRYVLRSTKRFTQNHFSFKGLLHHAGSVIGTRSLLSRQNVPSNVSENAEEKVLGQAHNKILSNPTDSSQDSLVPDRTVIPTSPVQDQVMTNRQQKVVLV